MICQECGKELTNEKDCYGHDCEVGVRLFKCRSCGNKYAENFCATKDVSICRWCREEK